MTEFSQETSMRSARPDSSFVEGLRPLPVHYFRIPRHRWELMLKRLIQMGADTVQTPIPWAWHNPRRDVFDLTGLTRPERDVTGFLATCAALDLRVFLDAGPYVGQGLLMSGLPAWTLEQHADGVALNVEKQSLETGSVTLLPGAEHPAFLGYLEEWYAQLGENLSAAQQPEGPVMALQVSGPSFDQAHLVSGTASSLLDNNTHVTQVLWPIWLRKAYENVAALNVAWNTDYQSINQAILLDLLASAPEESPVREDIARFVDSIVPQAEDTYVRLLRAAGWEVPIFASSQDPLPLAADTPAHICQIDVEPDEITLNVSWATEDAPLLYDGTPRTRFWSLKEEATQMNEGVLQMRGATLVTGRDNRVVSLPAPDDRLNVYRLTLGGQLLDREFRIEAGLLYVNYVAEDEPAVTDMFIVHHSPSSPFPAGLRDYLRRLLRAQALGLTRVSLMCQAMQAALIGTTQPVAGEKPVTHDILAAQLSLEAAHQAARRAATSLGMLEQIAARSGLSKQTPAPYVFNLAGFNAAQMDQLVLIREACSRATAGLSEAARILSQLGGEEGGRLTAGRYRSAQSRSQAAVQAAEENLKPHLIWLRLENAAGALPPFAHPILDWLTQILQTLNEWD